MVESEASPGGTISASQNVTEDALRLSSGRTGARVAVLNDRSLSLGVAQRVHDPAAERAQKEGLAVVRRSTGGTGVLHLPGDLVWSLILRRTDARVGRDFVGAYGRLGGPVADFLAVLGITSAWLPAPGLSESCCLLGSRGHSLFVGDRVIGGAAQHLTRSHLLHHGVVCGSVDRDATERLFALPARVAQDRLVGLRDLGVEAPAADLARQLLETLERAGFETES